MYKTSPRNEKGSAQDTNVTNNQLEIKENSARDTNITNIHLKLKKPCA